MTMEGIQNWCNKPTSSSSCNKSIRLGRQRSSMALSNHKSSAKTMTTVSYIKMTRCSVTKEWRVKIWRRIKKEKKKIFRSIRHDDRVRVSYDPSSYLKNFDQGCSLNEPDCYSRSFSARYAHPSRI
ncbi:hypothetical protein MKW92_033522 [Papaver armeniacum]|nr:hypothetical protein MKW92_033522 [Papaver armeniacum]